MWQSFKENLAVNEREPVFYMDEEVTYAQTDAWFGHVTRDLRMDIIYPQTYDERTFPCIVWICGGGWTQMDRGAHMPYLAGLARKGFVVASADYRLGHEAPFPSALVDIKTAIRYLRANAKRYYIDAKKIGVMGESAGGYLTAMVALANDMEFEQGGYLGQSSAVQAACPWYMPCDLYGMLEDTADASPFPFFDGKPGDEKYRKYINPLTYITKKAPPFLLLHGTEDNVVPFGESEMMFDALTKNETDVKLVAIEGAGHADIHFFQEPVWDIITGFFKDTLGR
jgi:acetyl esterase/lipase